jgi:hypothetical protein
MCLPWERNGMVPIMECTLLDLLYAPPRIGVRPAGVSTGTGMEPMAASGIFLVSMLVVAYVVS